MIRRFAPLLVGLALAGCAHDPLNTGDVEMDFQHAQSWQTAQQMRGKEYIFVARATVCPDQASAALGRPLFNPLPHTVNCPTVSTGRFRVVDAMLTRDGGTLLQIAGDGISGYMPYENFLPKPYKPVSEYFPTGK